MPLLAESFIILIVAVAAFAPIPKNPDDPLAVTVRFPPAKFSELDPDTLADNPSVSV